MRGAGNRRRGPGGARTKLGGGVEAGALRAPGWHGSTPRLSCGKDTGSGGLRGHWRREIAVAVLTGGGDPGRGMRRRWWFGRGAVGEMGIGHRVPRGSNLRKSAAGLGVSAKGGHPEDRGGGLGCGRCAEGKRREIAPTCGPGVAERVGARGRSGLVQEETGPLCARQAERGRASAGGWAARLERKRRSGRYWAGAVAG